MSRHITLFLLLGSFAIMACDSGPLPDDPERFVGETSYRRGVLLRDLTDLGNDYGALLAVSYGLDGQGWDLLPERDLGGRALTTEDLQRLQAGETLDSLDLDSAQEVPLAPDGLPSTEQAWQELGQRVFFEYPCRADADMETLAATPDGLSDSGFVEHDGTWPGLRVFRDTDGSVRIGPTCSACHAGVDADGHPTAAVASRTIDSGAALLLVHGYAPGDVPEWLDGTDVEQWERWGPGRVDVLTDSVFNPYAVPDLGGVSDLPFLNHTGNWAQTGTASLAVMLSTEYTFGNDSKSRIPDVLAWAMAEYLRSVPAPPPADSQPDAAAVERGAEVFDDLGCSDCHVSPLYTSAIEVEPAEIGADPAATRSHSRGTGWYRVPSLLGVGSRAPYMHDGSISSLDDLLDPDRPGDAHRFADDLGDGDRDAVRQFLRSL